MDVAAAPTAEDVIAPTAEDLPDSVKEALESLNRNLENPFFYLVINWLAGMNLGRLTDEGRTQMRKVLRQRSDCSAVIHGLWIHSGGENENLSRVDVPKRMFDEYQHQLYVMLRENNDLFVFLKKFWFDVYLWQDGQEQAALNEVTWSRLRINFNIVISEYIKHGELSKILFVDYIRVAKILFEEVKLVEKFRNATRIQFPGNTGQTYSIDTETASVRKVHAVELASALQETYISEFSFIGYKPQSPSPGYFPYLNHIGKICCLSEVKAYFDIHLKKMGGGPRFHCNHHGFGCRQNHLSVLLNNDDRLKLYEKTRLIEKVPAFRLPVNFPALLR